MTQVDWKPWPNEKPRMDGEYILTVKDKGSIKSTSDYWGGGDQDIKPCWQFYESKKIIAWAKMPKPYQTCQTTKNNSVVTTALAHTAQGFSRKPWMFDVLDEKGFLGIPLVERAIIMLATYFEIDKEEELKELRERFYRLFYPKWADLALGCNANPYKPEEQLLWHF